MKKIFTILCAVGLITTAKAQVQIPNGGFESWSGTPSAATNWADIDEAVYPLVGNVDLGLVSQETTASNVLNGNSSIKITSKYVAAATDSISGILSNGGIAVGGTGLTVTGVPYTDRPDSFHFAFKYRSSTFGKDTGYIQVLLTKWNGTARVNLLGVAFSLYDLSTLIPTLPNGFASGTFAMQNLGAGTPDTLSIIAFSSSTDAGIVYTGSTLWLDSMYFKSVVTTPPTATVTPAGPINICAGGSQVLTASTGAGYTYVWSNASGPIGGATSGTYTASATGTYTVKVTSTGGTATSNAVVVTQNPNPGVTVAVTQSNCATPTGTATATGTGGTGTLSYTWSPSGSGATLTGKPAGLYTVTVTDTKGCTATASKTITNPNAPTASLGSSTPPTCSYSTNGQATITASGGSGSGYTYTWSAGANTATRNDLAGGTAYTVTVKDGLSCAATATISVNLTAPAALAPTQSNVNAVKCKGGNNGTATLSTTGGTPNYTYAWGGGVNGAAQTALTAKTYQVTVTDSKSCTATTSVIIGEPAAALSATTTKTATTATAVAAGGTPNYTYKWSTNPQQNAATATGLAKGTYTVTVTDANLCSTTTTVTVTGPTSLETISAGISTLNVYPNPSNGVFNLEVSLKDASDLTISVSDIAGRKAFETTEKNVTDLTKQISLTNLSKGIYVVNIKTATGSANQRIVIE